MNILLWVVQGALALFFLAGGGFKVSNPGEVAKQAPGLPNGAWRFLGVVEVVGALLLIVPAATGWMPVLTPIAAAVLAVESLGLSLFYGRHSLEVKATNPLVFAVPMLLGTLFVAYGRYALVGVGAG